MASSSSSANTGRGNMNGIHSISNQCPWGFEMTKFTYLLARWEELEDIDQRSKRAAEKKDSGQMLNPQEDELYNGIQENDINIGQVEAEYRKAYKEMIDNAFEKFFARSRCERCDFSLPRELVRGHSTESLSDPYPDLQQQMMTEWAPAHWQDMNQRLLDELSKRMDVLLRYWTICPFDLPA
jgi:hypothetical protein